MQSKILKKMQRSIVTNFLDTIILAELKKSGPLSGYDLMDSVHRKFDFLISPGTVYSLLYSMERKGLVKGVRAQTKRMYVLTDKGVETINGILMSKEEIQGFIRICISG